MAKVKEDLSRVRLEVDGKQAINQLGKLEMEAKELRIDMKNAKKGTQEYVDAHKKLKVVEANIKSLRKEIGLTGMTMTQLSRYQRELRREITNTTTKGTAEYRKLKAELIQVNKVLTQQRKELNGTAGFFGDIKKELKSFAVLAVGALGITELIGGMQNLIRGSAELSDAISDVQKTTGLAKSEVEELNRELKAIDTRTSRRELLQLAADAGKLGITGRKEILDFVNGADKINVALGEDLGEDAIKNIGKLNELFGIRDIFGYGEGMLKTGSAINELGASSTASEGYLVDFTKRLGGAAKSANITMTDILGLGATLDSLGQQSETSSTALGVFLVDMFKETSTYAEIAGMEVEEFTKLLNRDANEALIQVLEGLKGNNEGFTTMVAKLEQVGVEGSRGTQIISSLANNTKLLREQQQIANEAFEEGTSIMKEFNTKNENFAGNLQKIQKWFAQFFVNSGVMNALNSFVEAWAKWIEIPISDKLEEERIELNKLYVKILHTNEGTEERKKLIEELKRQYPQYLSQIDADYISNDNLSTAIKRVNDQLINKIILQQKDEQIQAKNEEIGEKRIRQMEIEDFILAKITKLSEKYNVSIREGETLVETARNLAEDADIWSITRNNPENASLLKAVQELELTLNQINTLENDNNALIEKREELMVRLGIATNKAFEQSQQGLGRAGFLSQNTTTPATNPGTPEPTNEDVNNFANEVEEVFRNMQVNAAEAKDTTLLSTELMFDQLIGLGKKFNIDMSQLEEEREKQKKENLERIITAEEAAAHAREQIGMGLSMALGAAIDFIGNRQGEMTGFQKILGLAQIAIDSAVAIGKLPLLAADSAKGTGPLAPIVVAANIATMTGTVLSAISKAKNILTQTNVPDWEDGGTGGPRDVSPRRRAVSTPRSSFYYGGYTGDLGMGAGDQFGEFAGMVHQREYVIPEVTVSDPYVANLMPAIEQIRQDTIRGFSSMNGNVNAGLEKKLDQLISVVSKWPKEVKGKWVYSELEELEEEDSLLKSRYRA